MPYVLRRNPQRIAHKFLCRRAAPDGKSASIYGARERQQVARCKCWRTITVMEIATGSNMMVVEVLEIHILRKAAITIKPAIKSRACTPNMLNSL